MQFPYQALAPDYASLLPMMTLTRAAEIEYVVAQRKANRYEPPCLLDLIDAGHYDAGCKALGVPVPLAAASFEREASSNFLLSPAQGDPINRKSIHVPAGHGPYPNWTTAQEDAYRIDGLDKIGAANWTWVRACYEEELFNGFGYRAHKIHSPYLFAGTSLYARGKYVADGQWSPSAIDTQLGVIPMMLRIVQLRPALALADAFPAPMKAPPSITPAPAPAPDGHHDAVALHEAMNKLLDLKPPFPANDDNYDRFTRAAVLAFQKKAGFTGNDVDGIAGDKTWKAINQALAKAA